MKTLIIDNYDSFTYNLYQYLGELGAEPEVARNDEVSVGQIETAAPERIVISPGPGSADDPSYFGVCAAVIKELGPRLPILGVCLGHQGIIHVYGGRLSRAPYPVHGKIWQVQHDHTGIFTGLSSPLEGMRYHSLLGERSPSGAPLPECLRVNAWTAEGLVMGVRHVQYPTHGIQFHPESIGTPRGRELLANFLRVKARTEPSEAEAMA